MKSKSIASHYLIENSELNQFVNYNPLDIDWKKIIDDRSAKNVDRNLLVKVLKEQNSKMPKAILVDQNIELLLDKNTFTITTGHQICWMTGPMYMIYKILSVIKNCEELKLKFPENNFVPVFWMATEDHDFLEMNHFYTDFYHKVTFSGEFQGATGRNVISDEIQNFYQEFPLIQEFYQKGETWAFAFRKLIHFLFSNKGLVILDADNNDLKSKLLPVIENELEEKSYFEIEKTNEKLHSLDFPIQLKPRPLNLFVLENERVLLKKEQGKFYWEGCEKEFSKSEILEMAKNNPGFFSPNAALRPVYQELILPNLAYIGGWGEIAYWLQLKSTFQINNAFYPLILPRFNATILTQNQVQELENHSITINQILDSEESLKSILVQRLWDESNFDTDSKNLLKDFETFTEKWSLFEPNVTKILKGQEVKTVSFIENLKKKIGKNLINRNPLKVKPILNLKHTIQPDGFVQERVLNLMCFANEKSKILELIEKIYSEIDTQSFSKKIIVI